MNRFLTFGFIFLLVSCSSQLQDKQPIDKGNWDVYMAMYDKGAGSTTLNMDLVKHAPKKDLPYLLITGVTFINCTNDGFPNKDEFNNLYKVSDNVQEIVARLNKMELVGTFTYQCERLDHIYISDTTQIRSKLIELYNSKFSNYKYYINIKRDDNWDAYLKFLYPNEETQEYMSNQKVIEQLKAGGDNLTKARQVDHWLYFANANDRDLFEKSIVNNGYKIENKEKLDNSDKPYELQISRTDKVDPESINVITLNLRRKAKQLNGDYDGWETFIVKE
jgi:regulator of RNase E activity RraB